MAKLLFGTAGIPHSTKQHNSVSGIARVKELGLGAMELEFVYGVRMKKEAAMEVKKAAGKSKVSLSVHAPYYINLNAQEKGKLGLSKHNILESCRIGSLAGAGISLFHPGFYLKMDPKEVYRKIKIVLEEILGKLKDEGIKIRLGLETTGKGSAFGSLEECIMLSEELVGVFPVPDFAHIHASGNGRLNTKEAVKEAVGKIPGKFLKNLHMHISGIMYTEKGERKHLTFGDRGNDFGYKPVLEALKDAGVSGTIICESPSIEDDALLMQKYWEKL